MIIQQESVYTALNELKGTFGKEAQGLVEYALIIILIAVIVLIVLAIFGSGVGNMFSNIISNI